MLCIPIPTINHRPGHAEHLCFPNIEYGPSGIRGGIGGGVHGGVYESKPPAAGRFGLDCERSKKMP